MQMNVRGNKVCQFATLLSKLKYDYLNHNYDMTPLEPKNLKSMSTKIMS